ncbi:hypothetical protein ACG02S_10845 [Roseateles sp. DC23W]|uniref:Uncharacterized protein n=1 Tax=Pelomonas dachongensis TaxID=3299029 RepID=A0ABW7EMG7_9BURK
MWVRVPCITRRYHGFSAIVTESVMRRIPLCASLFALCALFPPSFAGPGIALEATTLEQARNGVSRLGFLKKLNAATAEAAATASVNERGDLRTAEGANLLEMMGILQSFVGDTDGAMATFDLRESKRRPRLPAISDAALEGLVAEEAIQAIVEQARSRRVVLINEAHHVPLHRAFTMKLARELRKIGYEYFAAETLIRDGVGAPGSEVTQRDGALIHEPNYAELLRDVGRDGWKVVAYEWLAAPEDAVSGLQRLQLRETAQARNLVEKVLKPHPSAKLLVHVGYFHLDKRPAGNSAGLKLMGAMLRELGATEPLAVDQSTLYSHPHPAMEPGSYRQLINAKAIRIASVLRKADGTAFMLGTPQSAIDLQIIHPPYGNVDGRPAWLMSVAGRQPADIPPALVPTEAPRVVYAFRADDRSLEAIPVDAVLLRPGQEPARLMLPPGRYRLQVED